MKITKIISILMVAIAILLWIREELHLKKVRETPEKPAFIHVERLPVSEQYPKGAQKAVFPDLTLIIPQEYLPIYDYKAGTHIRYHIDFSGEKERSVFIIVQENIVLPQQERIDRILRVHPDAILRQSLKYPKLQEYYYPGLKNPFDFLLNIDGKTHLIGCLPGFQTKMAIREENNWGDLSCDFYLHPSKKVMAEVRFDARLLPYAEELYYDVSKKIQQMIITEKENK